jgi:hypothetical protein
MTAGRHYQLRHWSAGTINASTSEELSRSTFSPITGSFPRPTPALSGFEREKRWLMMKAMDQLYGRSHKGLGESW